MANNNFVDWVKPYDDGNNVINSGAGHFISEEGYPVHWKVTDNNYGRLKKQAIYRFRTNDTQYTGTEDSKQYITKTATILQHGQPIFVTGSFNGNIPVVEGQNTIVFNLADLNLDTFTNYYGIIETASDLETNALYFEIGIEVGPTDEEWRGDETHVFTPVSWLSNTQTVNDYLNCIRENTYHAFTIRRDAFVPSLGYLEEDTIEFYKFKMVYWDKGNLIRITTGTSRDASDYFGNADVTFMNFNNLNSTTLEVEADNSTSPYNLYYRDLLTKGETTAFKYKFSTTVNPVGPNDTRFFELFTTNNSAFEIEATEMLHLIITIKPYGYKQALGDIGTYSSDWNYLPYILNVYIINCALDPYLLLGSTTTSGNYTNISSPLNANEPDLQDMPVWSNMGWDVSLHASTQYVSYPNN